MIQGAIFDADGTLLDSMGMWDTVGERYLASLGVTARPGLADSFSPQLVPVRGLPAGELWSVPVSGCH